MAMVRAVRVGFKGANGKIERVETTVPADWISGDKDALTEIFDNDKVRTRLSVTPGAAIWAEISAPYDNSPRGMVL